MFLPDKFFTQSQLTFVFSALEAFPGIVDVGNRLTLLQKLISIYMSSQFCSPNTHFLADS